MIDKLRRNESLVAALTAWLLARVLVGAGFAAAVIAADELRPGIRPFQITQGVFAWDAAFYRDIADRGYDGVATEGLRFFPLLPLAARGLGVVLGVGLALFLVVQIASLVAGFLLHRLARQELGDADAANRVAWLMALLPPAAVLVLGYAESLFLALSIGFFLAIRRGRWDVAIGLGLLAGLCRPMGMTLALPALIEAVRLLRNVPWRGLLARAAAIAAPVVGGGLYLAWVEAEYGAWDLPIRLQNSADLRGGWNSPIDTILDAVRALGDGWGEGLHVPWIAAFAVLLVVVFRTLPVSYGAWTSVLLLSALTGHTLGSFERYGLVAFPLLLGLAIVTRHPLVERVVLLGSAAGLATFTTLTFLGAFVP